MEKQKVEVLSAIHSDVKDIKHQVNKATKRLKSPGVMSQFNKDQGSQLHEWVQDTQKQLEHYQRELNSSFIAYNPPQSTQQKVMDNILKAQQRLERIKCKVLGQEEIAQLPPSQKLTQQPSSQRRNQSRMLSSDQCLMGSLDYQSMPPHSKENMIAVNPQKRDSKREQLSQGRSRLSCGQQKDFLNWKSNRFDSNSRNLKSNHFESVKNTLSSARGQDLNFSSKEMVSQSSIPSLAISSKKNQQVLQALSPTPTSLHRKDLQKAPIIDTAVSSTDTLELRPNSRSQERHTNFHKHQQPLRSPKGSVQQLNYQQELQRVWGEVQREKHYNQQLEAQIKQLVQSQSQLRLHPVVIDYEPEVLALRQQLQDQETQYQERESRYKAKLKDQKERYKRKLSEYEQYASSLKINYEHTMQENQSLQYQSKQMMTDIQQLQSETDNIGESLGLEGCQFGAADIIGAISKLRKDKKYQDQQLSQLQKVNQDMQSNIATLQQSLEKYKRHSSSTNTNGQQSSQQLLKSPTKIQQDKLSDKTIEITQRFDKLKHEIQKRVKLETLQQQKLTQNHLNQEEQILRQLEQRSKDLEKREQRVMELEKKFRENKNCSPRERQQEQKEKLRQSMEKERGDWQDKSHITQSELLKFSNMLEIIQNKLEKRDDVGIYEIQRDIQLTRTQIGELQEFHKRLRERSPITSERKKKPAHADNSNEKDQENFSPKIKYNVVKTKGFKLGIAKDFKSVEQSSCFESLHELCNIQIEELKKTVRILSDERDDMSDQLDEVKDRHQQLLNEHMELDMLYNTRMNEVSYLHKYLEDYEKEIDALKQALESQFKQLSTEKKEVYDKLNRTREKKKSLQSKLDSKDNSSYFAAITPHQDNQSVEFKIENEHLRSLNENQTERIKILEGFIGQKIKSQGSLSNMPSNQPIFSQEVLSSLIQPPLDEEHQFQFLLNSQSPSPFKIQDSSAQKYLQVPQNMQRNAPSSSQQIIVQGSKYKQPINLKDDMIEEEKFENNQESCLNNAEHPQQKEEEHLVQTMQSSQRCETGEEEEDASIDDQEEDELSSMQQPYHKPSQVSSSKNGEREIEDVSKIIRYEEFQYQSNHGHLANSHMTHNSEMETVGSNISQYTPQSTKGVPALPSQPIASERGSMTTREQRKLIKEDQLIGGEALSGIGINSNRANASKVFSFAPPRNNQDMKGQL